MESWKKVLLSSAAMAVMAFAMPVQAEEKGATGHHGADAAQHQEHHADDHGAPEGHAKAAKDNANAVHAPAKMPADSASDVNWAYAGANGPSHWAGLDDAFKTCSEGTLQSPINIAQYMQEDLPKLKIAYAPTKLHVFNSGHSIGVQYEPGSKFMSADKIYDLTHFNFHTPSENYVNGAPYPMEMQLVHKAEDGQVSILSVMMKLGLANPAIQTIWDNIPAAGEVVKRDDVTLDMADLLPGSGAYYTFTGSLTTPPCSENVKWHVLKEPIEISLDQLQAFQALYAVNARPVQPLNGRIIKGN